MGAINLSQEETFFSNNTHFFCIVLFFRSRFIPCSRCRQFNEQFEAAHRISFTFFIHPLIPFSIMVVLSNEANHFLACVRLHLLAEGTKLFGAVLFQFAIGKILVKKNLVHNKLPCNVLNLSTTQFVALC